jgi:16S rRNA (guanine527-N7)-methyltransferase
MTTTEFFTLLASNAIPLDEMQRHAFECYAAELGLWNSRVNLISRRDLEHVWESHLLPSVALLAHIQLPANARVADIGTGGGLPGIPLKICRPDLRFTLIDSVRKKTEAVAAMVSAIAQVDARMLGTTVLWGRAEEIARNPEHRGTYDVVVARAVAPLVDLAQWARPLLRAGGTMLALKGGDLTVEIEHATSRAHFFVSDTLLTMRGYDSLANEEKKVLTVTWPE